MDDLMLWVDVETSGLSAMMDELLEVGFVLTNTDLKVLREKVWLVGLNGFKDANESYRRGFIDGWDGIVKEMHEKSGLIEDWAQGPLLDEDEASEEMIYWIKECEFLDPPAMCGNNVPFDRLFLKYELPKVEEQFHYRNLDVSSIKNAYKIESPRIHEFWEVENIPVWKTPTDLPLHRPLDDLYISMQEYEFYREHFFR